MAIAYGPMLSLSASGGLGKTLLYRTHGGKTTVGRWTSPPNPKTAAQASIRRFNKMLGQEWSTITTPDQDTWNPAADELRLAPYHRYLSFNMQRWLRRQAPSQIEGAPEDDTPASIFLLAVTPATQNRIALTAVQTPNDAWHTLFYQTPTAAGPPTRLDFLTPATYRVGGIHAAFRPVPAPGTYYFWTRGFSKHGKWSNLMGPVTYVQP